MKINQIIYLLKTLRSNYQMLKNTSNSSNSEIGETDSSLEDKITQDKTNINSDLNKDLGFDENIKECSCLKNKAYIDKLITITNDAIEANCLNTRKKNTNEKRTLFKKNSVHSFNSKIDLNRINEEIKIYEEEKGKQKLMIEFKDKIVKVEGYQQIKIILDKLRPHKIVRGFTYKKRSMDEAVYNEQEKFTININGKSALCANSGGKIECINKSNVNASFLSCDSDNKSDDLSTNIASNKIVSDPRNLVKSNLLLPFEPSFIKLF